MGFQKVSIPSTENSIKVNKTLQNYRNTLFLSFCTHCENLKGPVQYETSSGVWKNGVTIT